jgi:alkylmercury lyase
MTTAIKTNVDVTEIARKLNAAGVPPDFGPDHSRLLVKLWRAVATGNPVTPNRIDEIIGELGVPRAAALEFLQWVSERDEHDNIVGLVGLSQNEWGHRLYVGDTKLHTWCAWDAMFMPPMIDQTVTIESESPVTKETVRLLVGPDGVLESEQPDAAVSIVLIDPDEVNVDSVEAVWTAFCHQVFFFESTDVARKWAEGKKDVEILSVHEAFELGKLAFSSVLAYADELSGSVSPEPVRKVEPQCVC